MESNEPTTKQLNENVKKSCEAVKDSIDKLKLGLIDLSKYLSHQGASNASDFIDISK